MRLLRAQGYPVPLVHEAQGTDLVMERLDGPTLAEAVLGGAVSIEQGATILADLHDRLRPTGYIHRDLHPFNVMLTSRGPVVIDWRNARRGPADADLAETSLVPAMVALDPAFPPAVGEFLESFLHKVIGDPQSELDGALRNRHADPNLTAEEKARLPEAARLVARYAIRIRPIRTDDLEALFEIYSEPEGSEMAAMPSRDRDAYFAHREKIMGDPANILRTVLCGSEIAGDVVSWDQAGDTLVGYRLGKRFWGRGIATRALELLVAEITKRPLRAFVAVHNAGSIRVLEKAGFERIGGPVEGEDGIAEYLYELT